MNAITARAAFLENRRRFIGGTDIAGIVGISPWSTPLSVYQDKIGESVEQVETLAMRRGLWSERFIAREFIREHPEYVVDLHPEPVIRDDWGFPAGASLDGLVRKRRAKDIVAVFEAKWTSAFNARGFDAYSGEMPDQYFTQVQWYMAVVDLDLAYLCVDAGDPLKMRTLPVKRDQAVIDRLVKAGRDFWTGHVLPRTPPLPNGSERDGEIVRRLHPVGDVDLALVLDGTADEPLSDYLAWSFKAEEASRNAEAAKQRLCDLMGDATRAVVGSWELKWRNQETKRLDTKALKEAEPETWEQFAVIKQSRVFVKPKELEG